MQLCTANLKTGETQLKAIEIMTETIIARFQKLSILKSFKIYQPQKEIRNKKTQVIDENMVKF